MSNPNGVSWSEAYEGMTCSKEGHAMGCPCQAGGDIELLEKQWPKARCRRCGKRLTSDGTCDSCAFDLSTAIKEQRMLGSYVIAPLSMLRCSECGDLLDYFGACKNHGATDAG